MQHLGDAGVVGKGGPLRRAGVERDGAQAFDLGLVFRLAGKKLPLALATVQFALGGEAAGGTLLGVFDIFGQPAGEIDRDGHAIHAPIERRATGPVPLVAAFGIHLLPENQAGGLVIRLLLDGAIIGIRDLLGEDPVVINGMEAQVFGRLDAMPFAVAHGAAVKLRLENQLRRDRRRRHRHGGIGHGDVGERMGCINAGLALVGKDEQPLRIRPRQKDGVLENDRLVFHIEFELVRRRPGLAGIVELRGSEQPLGAGIEQGEALPQGDDEGAVLGVILPRIAQPEGARLGIEIDGREQTLVQGERTERDAVEGVVAGHAVAFENDVAQINPHREVHAADLAPQAVVGAFHGELVVIVGAQSDGLRLGGKLRLSAVVGSVGAEDPRHLGPPGGRAPEILHRGVPVRLQADVILIAVALADQGDFRVEMRQRLSVAQVGGRGGGRHRRGALALARPDEVVVAGDGEEQPLPLGDFLEGVAELDPAVPIEPEHRFILGVVRGGNPVVGDAGRLQQKGDDVGGGPRGIGRGDGLRRPVIREDGGVALAPGEVGDQRILFLDLDLVEPAENHIP